MPAKALTDNNNLFGALEFSIECADNGLHPIIGTSINLLEIQEKNLFSQINLLAKNEIGYKNLLHLSSLSHTRQNDVVGLKLEDFRNYSEGLICFIGGESSPLLPKGCTSTVVIILSYCSRVN